MSRNILTVPSKAALEALVQHEDREIAFCEQDKTYYCYSSIDGWQQMPAEMTEEGLKIDLYSLNKQIILLFTKFIMEITNSIKSFPE